MIQAEMKNILIRCTAFDAPAEMVALKKALTFKVPNYWFARAYRNGVWDGTFTFWNGYSKTFPTGLYFAFNAKYQGLFVMKDLREKPEVVEQEPVLHGVELRDYQRELVDIALRMERCVVAAPTNAGKTEIAAGLLKARPCKTLWLTHRGNLMLQTRERLAKRLGEKVGLVYQDVFDVRRVTVAMVQTLYFHLEEEAYKKLLMDSECLVIDECHHQSAQSWLKIAKRCPAYYRYGLSATPLKADAVSDNKLMSMTGRVVKTVSNKDLIERGISAKPTIYLVKNEVKTRYAPGDYFEAYRMGVEENPERNAYIALIVRKHAKLNEPVLVLVNTIRHGLALTSILGHMTNFVEGSVGYADRQKKLRELESGKIKSIVATPIFDEGADVPNIRVVVLAGVGKSAIRLLQRIGRGMRKKEGVNEVTIYDFADAGFEYLDDHAKRRLEIYKEEGFEVIEVKQEVLT
jgi:superfamily II DNA or RNA helicase